MPRKYIYLVLIIVLIIISFVFAYLINQKSMNNVTSFEQCVNLGFPVAESYPRQCLAGSKTFVEEIVHNNSNLNSNNVNISAECDVAGCSGQLCVDAESASNMTTTCEYLPAYACYKEARCEKQSDGNCGWTITKQLEECFLIKGVAPNSIF